MHASLPCIELCERFGHVAWLLTGAELLIAENQSWCELDHHGCRGRLEQQHTAGAEEARQSAAGGRHPVC